MTTINRNPHLIGQIAISEGLLAPEKLAECIQLQASDAPSRALGDILVQKGYLTLEQLDWVISIQKTRFHRISADPARGGLFGQIALRLDYITLDQLNEGLRDQQGAGGDAPRCSARSCSRSITSRTSSFWTSFGVKTKKSPNVQDAASSMTSMVAMREPSLSARSAVPSSRSPSPVRARAAHRPRCQTGCPTGSLGLCSA